MAFFKKKLCALILCSFWQKKCAFEFKTFGNTGPLQNYEKFIPKKIRKFRRFDGYHGEKFSRWPKSSWTLTSNNSGQFKIERYAGLKFP